jgi:hypothetical protein
MDKEETSITKAEFLETFSLYRKVKIPEDEFNLPSRISLYCNVCGKETTWALQNTQPANRLWTFAFGSYQCVLCERESIRYYLHHDPEAHFIMKVGQYPEPSIAIPRALEKGLKDSAQHYRKGLICFSQGYGIGAVAYFRRVVEERTNELIDVVGELGRANGTEEKEVKRILAAKSERTYDKRLEVASQMIPASLRPGGINPLGRLHDLLSEALHVHSEEDALETAEEMRDIIEHVFRNLKDYIDAQRRYAEKVQRTTSAASATKASAAQANGKQEGS